MKATVAHATIGMMISKCGAGILYVVPVAKRSPDGQAKNHSTLGN